MLLKFELKQLDKQIHYFFRGGWLGGWVGGVEELRIKPSQLSTKLKLKLKLSLAITSPLVCYCSALINYVSVRPQSSSK